MFPLPSEPDITPTHIYNPSKEDFTWQWDGSDYLLPARGKILTFPKWLADHLAKHLANKLAQEDDSRGHHEEKVKKWLSRIYIEL
jgi:hypothetical protein